MPQKFILLVEDNPDDEALTLRALKKSKVANGVVVVRDEAEAVDFLFGTGANAGRDVSELPQVVLLVSSCRSWIGSKCCAAFAPTNAPRCCQS